MATKLREKEVQEVNPALVESYWDWLPMEIKQQVMDQAAYATAKARLMQGWDAICRELATLSRCRLYGMISNLVCFEKLP